MIAVEIRPLDADDVASLQKALPPEHPEAHVRRLADQRAGRITYLVAWREGCPLGHVVIRWGGTTNPELNGRLGQPTRHPYVEALLVHPSYRSRSVGSQLLATAEFLARGRGYDRIGLAVAIENVRARGLYERRGYADAGVGELDNYWSYVDEDGREVVGCETCHYLVKRLDSCQ